MIVEWPEDRPRFTGPKSWKRPASGYNFCRLVRPKNCIVAGAGYEMWMNVQFWQTRLCSAANSAHDNEPHEELRQILRTSIVSAWAWKGQASTVLAAL